MENVFDGWIQTLPKRHLSPWTVCWNATVVLVPYRFVVCVLAVCWVECYALFFYFYFLHWFPCPFTKKKNAFCCWFLYWKRVNSAGVDSRFNDFYWNLSTTKLFFLLLLLFFFIKRIGYLQKETLTRYNRERERAAKRNRVDIKK